MVQAIEATSPQCGGLAVQGSKHGLRLRRLAPAVAMAGFFALASLALVHFRESLSWLGAWGYLSVFVVELANSASVLIPTPGHAYTIAIAPALSPTLLGLIGGVGAALGELSGYMVGVRGREALASGRLHRRLYSLTRGRVGATLLVMAALPVPFDVAGLWAGTVRYPLARFMAFVLAGKVLKVTALALVGHYGLHWLLGPLG